MTQRLHSQANVRYLAALLLIASAAQADVFRILDDPHVAAQARIDLIHDAQNEIDAVCFLARGDPITLTTLALLRDAHRRGVSTVRLIVDANFLHVPKSVLAHLQEEGVQIRVYHPITLRHPLWLFTRMHEKVMVVDGKRYIAGGRNLAGAYFGMAKFNYVDRDVYVDGPSAAEAQTHFENLWASPDVADLHVRVLDVEKRHAERELDDLARAATFGGDLSEGQPDVPGVHFLHDPLFNETGPRVGTQLAELLGAAKKSIVIESPYVVPSKSLLDLLIAKQREGISVQIVTNSLRSADGVLAQAAYLRYRRRVARAGIDIREFKGPDSLHAKSIVIDDHIALVGSYNIDPRSENLNNEMMCMADDADTARELLESIDAHVANSWKVDVNGRTREHFAGQRSRSFRAWMVRMLLPVIQGQL